MHGCHVSRASLVLSFGNGVSSCGLLLAAKTVSAAQ